MPLLTAPFPRVSWGPVIASTQVTEQVRRSRRMRTHRTVLVTAAFAAGILALGAAATQDTSKPPATTKPAAAPEAGAMPQPPKPGPEHAILKREEAVWDARVEMQMGPPGTPAQVSTGLETNTLLGGLWLVSDFKGTMQAQPFQGHGTFGYDSLKKKYVGVWVDSMSSSLMRTEGDYDAAAGALTMIGEGPGPDGNLVKFREVMRWTDAR